MPEAVKPEQPTSVETKPKKRPPIGIEFRDVLISAIICVSQGEQKLSEGKAGLHMFISSLSETEKSSLSPNIVFIANRVRDIATALASEVPALQPKLQLKESTNE